MKHLRSLFDFTSDEVIAVLELSAKLKAEVKAGERRDLLPRHTLLQIFEKPSLRTRASFETAMIQLGGAGLFFTAKDIGLDGRETPEDVARVAGGYADIITMRTFSQELVETFAEYSGVPVVNGLTDDFHPCQALTDYLTVQEHFGTDVSKDMPGRFVYVGDGNNVAKSLVLCSGLLNVPITIAAPSGYELTEDFIEAARVHCPNLDLEQTASAVDAVKRAGVVYTDVWASMGQEAEKESRSQIFADYQVNEELLSHAPKEAVFLHCLPARRDLEVTDAIMESPRSLVFPQAENRMHVAKGVFAYLLGVG